jgi:DNA invertase Pin-like site-specific DNA recombinase
MRAAIQAATEHGEAELWVFHSSRLARGDGTKGKRSLNLIVAQLLYENVRVRSVTDDTFVTPMLAGIGSEAAHKYSADLSAHTKRGLSQRKARGEPVGTIPLGYVADRRIVDGRVVSKRVVDPKHAPLVQRIFDLIESGWTPNQVAKQLNAEGLRTAARRDRPNGSPWTTRAIRGVVENEAYTGVTGYPDLIEAERWKRVSAGMHREDPAIIHRRKGGRPRQHDWLLGGLAFCGSCGAPMRCRRYYSGKRVYRCVMGLDARGLCDSRPVPADLIEAQVLEHLDVFVGSVETWICEHAEARSEDRKRQEEALERQRDALAEQDRSRERHLAEYRRLVDEGRSVAYVALEEVERVDAERDSLQHAIAEAEAVLQEWGAGPDVDAALDYYIAIRDVIDGKVRAAQGVKELNASLSTVIAGIWMRLEDGRLTAEFELRPSPHYDSTRHRTSLPGRDPILAELVQRSLEGRAWWLRNYAKPHLTPSCTATSGGCTARG